MPPWPARLLPGSSASSNKQSARPVTDRNQILQHQTEIQDATSYPYGIPRLNPTVRSPASQAESPIRPPSRHERSRSHPFPSILGGSKKNEKKYQPDDDFTTDSAEEDNSVSQKRLDLPFKSRNSNKTQQQQANKDYTQGNCKTCDSLVRWPKPLKTFRCFVCLMINDVEPIDANRTGSIQQPQLLSVEQARSIIDRCIKSYLETRTASTVGNSSVTGQTTSATPSSMSPEVADNEEARECSKDNEQATGSSVTCPPIYLSSPPIEMRPLLEDPFVSNKQQSDYGIYSASLPENIPSTLPIKSVEHFLSEAPSRTPPPPPGKSPSSGHNPQMRGPVSSDPNSTLAARIGKDQEESPKYEKAKLIFKPLEDYIITCFGTFDNLNASFSTSKVDISARSVFESRQVNDPDDPGDEILQAHSPAHIGHMDAKTLLLGDVAENGSWWAGDMSHRRRGQGTRKGATRSDVRGDGVSIKTPRIDWAELHRWYQTILRAGDHWKDLASLLGPSIGTQDHTLGITPADTKEIESDIRVGRWHAQRTLLKSTEVLLKRPGRTIRSPEDVRFILILLANPLLYPSHWSNEANRPEGSKNLTAPDVPALAIQRSPGQHSVILKRIFGLLANLPNECHHFLVSWFSRYSERHFRRLVELLGSFISYRLSRPSRNKSTPPGADGDALIPEISASGTGASVQLHAALGSVGSSKHPGTKPKTVVYGEDWQIRAAARVMALLFSANTSGAVHRSSPYGLDSGPSQSAGLAALRRAHSHGQILPTSDFYNMRLDYFDLVVDFEAWESRRSKFSFCEYPFLLSIWAKIRILEYDARRQMEVKAREAFFDSIMSRKLVSQYSVLKVRRNCLVEDSLRSVSEIVGSGQEEIKKALRIEFVGEEGVDAGGLRKEWFLLLVKEVFDPNHGMFEYDEESRYCYFNPNSFETSDQYYLVGVVLGLAIYNSIILDVALPPFAFKKLMVSASSTSPSPLAPRSLTLDDLAEYRPSLARGLKQLLDFDGDVDETFCQDFVANVDRYGQVTQIPLCPNGEQRSVTNSNRQEFVDLYVHYLLDTAVARQFEPFKRGFYTVCRGNALSLFRPEEIDLLIRGSDEPLDVSSLRAVATYDNWNSRQPNDTELVLQWFWQFFREISPPDQRKLLSFITGSDRIPAMGTTNLIIKINCLGEDTDRFPVARTCFNMIGLYRYNSREKLTTKLWRAVVESEGFGLK